MAGLIQRLLPARGESGERERAPGPLCPRVLVVSADVRFYADVLSAVNSRVWQADWARSLESAVEVSKAGAIPIVVYDENLPDVDWRDAFRRLAQLTHCPRLLLAAREVDEQLWRRVLLSRGYDVVPRNADSTQMRRTLRFAWMSVCEVSEPGRAID
jgi:DNA-binding response OmpR family regulator